MGFRSSKSPIHSSTVLYRTYCIPKGPHKPEQTVRMLYIAGKRGTLLASTTAEDALSLCNVEQGTFGSDRLSFEWPDPTERQPQEETEDDDPGWILGLFCLGVFGWANFVLFLWTVGLHQGRLSWVDYMLLPFLSMALVLVFKFGLLLDVKRGADTTKTYRWCKLLAFFMAGIMPLRTIWYSYNLQH